jgi:hypothetical protein
MSHIQPDIAHVETDLAGGRVPRDEWVRQMTEWLSECKHAGLPFDRAWKASLHAMEEGVPDLWGADPDWHVEPELPAYEFFRQHAEAAYNDAQAPLKHCQREGCWEHQPCPSHGETRIEWADVPDTNDALAPKAVPLQLPTDAVHCITCGREHSPGDETHGKPELQEAA